MELKDVEIIKAIRLLESEGFKVCYSDYMIDVVRVRNGVCSIELLKTRAGVQEPIKLGTLNLRAGDKLDIKHDPIKIKYGD